jgi:hypothetical protein
MLSGALVPYPIIKTVWKVHLTVKSLTPSPYFSLESPPESRCKSELLRNNMGFHLVGRPAENRMVIWGTDVVVEESREKFMKFITQYLCQEFDEQGK